MLKSWGSNNDIIIRRFVRGKSYFARKRGARLERSCQEKAGAEQRTN
jgi:hypothetical protein